jgi:phospholipid/cholesterol/gamma-HCH transport system substrate-binding protein
MKISNELKVGVLSAAAIACLIIGFNFLKGKDIFKTGNFLFAKYTDTKGITVSNGVFVNGYKVGTVYGIESADPNLKDIIVTIKLNGIYNIPKNSIASIEESMLSSPTMNIIMGNDTHYLTSGDTISTVANESLLSSLGSKIAPVGDQLKATMISLNNVLNNANSLLDDNSKRNIKQSIANLDSVTASLIVSTKAIQALLVAQSGAIGQTLNNVNSFTKNLADNNEKVTQSMANLEKTTENFANADIDGIVNSLKKATNTLNDLLDKVNSKDGTVGLLMNDKTLYNNLNSTIRSANILMDDLKVHPKRYIKIFGKADKTPPLTEPLATDTLSHP